MRVVLLLAGSSLLAACNPWASDSDTGRTNPFNRDAQEEAAPAIFSATPIAGTNWLAAQVGMPGTAQVEIASSASYTRLVSNIYVIDKASGATAALVPGESNRVRSHAFVWPEAGTVSATRTLPQGSEGGVAGTGSDGLAPTHFLVDVESLEDEDAGRRLIAGSFADYETAVVAEGYSAIHHMEMLDSTQLSLLISFPDRTELLIVDLPGGRISQRSVIAPDN